MIASRDGAWPGGGFSTMPESVRACPVLRRDLGDAVAAGLVRRHLGERHHAPARAAVKLDEGREAGRVAEEQLVRQQHREGLVADQIARAEHGMAEAERLLLAGEGGGAGGQHRARGAPARVLVPARRKIQVEFLVATESRSIAASPRPVTKMNRSIPAARASSTAYWISGLSTTGSISLDTALVAGRKRVPMPATGSTAFLTGFAIAGASSR